MKSLASRVAALEKRQKTIVSDEDYEEKRFTGDDGKPWIRYTHKRLGAHYPVIELPCNGRDDPIEAISERVEAGEAKPLNLTPGESEMWDVSLMGKIGKQIIQRILAGEVMPEDLTPNERECWELVEAVREKY